jgi:hypothetical protein
MLRWVFIAVAGVAWFGACARGDGPPIVSTTTIGFFGGGFCGNGIVDVGEECDGDSCCLFDCTRVPDCTSNVQPCSDGSPGPNCGCTKSGAGSKVPCHCSDVKVFARAVTNPNDPTQEGIGLTGRWARAGEHGLGAGNAMCQEAGADHVCSYEEVVQADANGELAKLPLDATYWLSRTTPVPNPTLAGTTCNSNAECGAGDVCDEKTHACQWQPGPYGNCDGWVIEGGVPRGEWFRRLPDALSSSGVAKGSLSHHFVRDALLVGKVPPCQDDSVMGCAGRCDAERGILCCYAKCK